MSKEIRLQVCSVPKNLVTSVMRGSRDGVDQKTLLEQIQPNPAIDTVKLVSGAILWTISRDELNKSRLKQIISLPLYKQTTIRNVNTTRKIFELMNNLSES